MSPPKRGSSQPFRKSPWDRCTHGTCDAASSPLSGTCSLDFSEDNDADDEGEIWYNPIPEEDELGIASVLSLEEANAATVKLSALSVNMLSARDLRKAEPPGEELPCPAHYHTGDVQTTQSNGIHPVDSVHSAGVRQQGRPRSRHRTQDGVMAEDSPVLRSAFTGEDGGTPGFSFSCQVFDSP